VRTPAAVRRGGGVDPRSFDSVLAAVLADLKARWYSPSIQKHGRLMLGRFFSHLRSKRVRDIRDVTEAHVFAYARELATMKSKQTGKLYSASTQRTHLYLVQRLFRFLLARGVILQDPSLNLVLPSWTKLPRAVLNQNHARKILTNPDPFTARGRRDRAILELLYGTAVRVGECERLDLGDVDLTRGELMVRNGKGRKDRMVPIVGRAAAAVDLYLREARSRMVKNPREQALFINNRGVRVNIKRIQQLVRDNAKAAGLDIRVTPHTLRHGCATHLLQEGADVRHVQQLLGHASVQTTALYTRVVPSQLAKAMKKAHPREKTYARRSRRQGAARKRP
jgi:integrase/recombinase XerD